MSQYSGVSLLCNACTQAVQAVLFACSGVDVPPAQVMLAGTQPPPSSTSRSCVYVVKRPDGMFYCGQSDNLTSTPLPAICSACQTIWFLYKLTALLWAFTVTL